MGSSAFTPSSDCSTFKARLQIQVGFEVSRLQVVSKVCQANVWTNSHCTGETKNSCTLRGKAFNKKKNTNEQIHTKEEEFSRDAIFMSLLRWNIQCWI